MVGDYPETANLIRTALKTNESMPEYVLNRTYEVMRENGIESSGSVGIYGLTYKGDVDDVRESPTMQMIELMKRCLVGAGVKVYDPWVRRDEVSCQIHSIEEFL